jgi:hypothetical protein
MGEIRSKQGLNQETSLKRTGDTHWRSHYRTILNLILMFSTSIVCTWDYSRGWHTLRAKR